KAILSLETEKLQQEAAEKIVAEGMNVRAAEALCRKMAKQPKQKQRTDARPPLPSEVELSLKEVLGTEVHVQYKDGRGTLNLGFYSDEQLRAFANLLGGYQQ
ncbi:MAG: stage 0 sporulation protein J, partial [Ruthenibacterium sp.]